MLPPSRGPFIHPIIWYIAMYGDPIRSLVVLWCVRCIIRLRACLPTGTASDKQGEGKTVSQSQHDVVERLHMDTANTLVVEPVVGAGDVLMILPQQARDRSAATRPAERRR